MGAAELECQIMARRGPVYATDVHGRLDVRRAVAGHGQHLGERSHDDLRPSPSFIPAALPTASARVPAAHSAGYFHCNRSTLPIGLAAAGRELAGAGEPVVDPRLLVAA